MNIHRTLQSLLFIGILLLSSFQVTAHSLEETNARITLRDGQVEVRILADMHHWQVRLQDNKAWLLGDTDQVMPLDLNHQQVNAFLKQELEHKTTLMVNNQTVSIRLSTLPAEQEKSNNPSNNDYAEIVLTAKHSQVSVDKLNISFPKSLGAVHASFVKPSYKMISAGSTASVSFSGSKLKSN